MDFSFSDEQRQLRDSVHGYLRDHYPFERRRAASLSDTGQDAGTWADFADQLGILSLADPDTSPDPVDLMVIMEEFGDALVIEPFLETVVTGAALLRSAKGDAARSLLSGIVAGKVQIALAWAEPETRYSWQPKATVAKRDGNTWRIDGLKSTVVGAPWATHLIVSAVTSSGTSLFVIRPDTPGVTLSAYPTIDGRRAANIAFDNVLLTDEALLGIEGAALPILEAIGDATIAAQCAEAVGVMRRMLRDTTDYTKQRQQFGQAISGFQALQHRMVDMFIQTEMASSAVYLATLKLGAAPADRKMACSVAKAIVGEACRFVGQNAVQLHGGMGMTDELAVGHYFKRATVIEGEFGTVDYHVGRFARTHSELAVAQL